MNVPVGSVAGRRARLARRHLLLPVDRVGTVAGVCDALVGLHSSDPVTVYLSAAARLTSPAISLVDDALYRDREVVRLHAMRRTLWVLTPHVARAAHTASAATLVGPMRRTMCSLLAGNSVTEDPERWLERAITAIAGVLDDLGEATARQVGEALPELTVKLEVPPGNSAGASIAAHTRVLNLMGFEGAAVRARPLGTWASGQYRWTPTDRWVSGGLRSGNPSTAITEIVGRYLRAFGPATISDIRWWTGWTKLMASTALADSNAQTVDGTDDELWVADGDDADERVPGPWVALLPGLDPTVMGWKQRQWYLPDDYVAHLFDRNGNAGPTIWADGRVVGGWTQRADGQLAHRLFEQIPAAHEKLLHVELERLETFVGDTRFTTRFPSPVSRELSA